MKKILIVFMVLLSSVVKAQVIDYNHFDKKLFEKVLFNTLNERRKTKGLDTLAWSNVLYKEASVRNINIVTKNNKLFHPDFTPIWDSTRVRSLIAKESDKVVGGVTSVSEFAGPSMTYFENIFWSKKTNETYQDLANRVINGWESSYMHNAVQYSKFEKKGKPGLASCTIGFVKGTDDLYVVFNFVEVFRK